jgi:hypothetical protein
MKKSPERSGARLFRRFCVASGFDPPDNMGSLKDFDSHGFENGI